MVERVENGRLTAGSPANPVPFGDYFLLGMIARGGMAEVYRARERNRDGEPRLLAIKVMRPQLAREARFAAMFDRESKLAMMLQSRSIVRALDAGVVDRHPYIAMEYIAGRDLNQLLRRCQEQNIRVSVPHAVAIAARIAEGLGVAHNLRDSAERPLNLVNRDVSPSNVRLSYGGEVKLLDFGIAQAVMTFTSEIGVLKGKFSYMSPEQIRGLPLDARSDLFSCGVVLHEMLTRQKLFRGETEFALMEKVRQATVAPPSVHNRRVTADLDAIVLKALARDVGQRYQSAADLQSDLLAVLEGYSFEESELAEFMRRIFRTEWEQERHNTEIALASLPCVGDPRAETVDELDPPVELTDGRSARGALEKTTPPESAEERGIWARLRKWRREP